MKSAKVLEAHKGRTKKCIQVQNGRWLTIYVSKKTLSCYETWFHNMRPGFKKKKKSHIKAGSYNTYLQYWRFSTGLNTISTL